jgi:secreted trypsin-like serine protease
VHGRQRLSLHDGLLVGSASRGVGDDAGACGTTPGIYTDLADYLPWIARTILGPGGAGGTPPGATAGPVALALSD